MAREVEAIPEQWLDRGVEYVVDIGDNQKKWKRFVQLRGKKLLDEDEQAEIKALEVEVEDLFTVGIGPYSHDEYKKIEEAETKKAVSVKIDGKGQMADVEISGAAMSIGERIAISVCRKRIFWVKGYVARFLHFDAATNEPVLDANGDQSFERKRLKTARELVDFITTQAWEDERQVIDDIFKAIRDRSHLSRGQKKTFNGQRSSLSPAAPL